MKLFGFILISFLITNYFKNFKMYSIFLRISESNQACLAGWGRSTRPGWVTVYNVNNAVRLRWVLLFQTQSYFSSVFQEESPCLGAKRPLGSFSEGRKKNPLNSMIFCVNLLLMCWFTWQPHEKEKQFPAPWTQYQLLASTRIY